MAVRTQSPCSFKHVRKKLQLTAKSFKKIHFSSKTLFLATVIKTILVLGKENNKKE